MLRTNPTYENGKRTRLPYKTTAGHKRLYNFSVSNLA